MFTYCDNILNERSLNVTYKKEDSDEQKKDKRKFNKTSFKK